MTKYKEIKIDIKVSPEILINEMLKQMSGQNSKAQENYDKNKKQ